MSSAASLVLKKLLARGALALLLVFAQQQAALHWLSHAIDATHAKAATSSTTAADHCDECLALAGMGAAATSAQPALPSSFARHARAAAQAPSAAPAPLRLAFRSRAPPILL